MPPKATARLLSDPPTDVDEFVTAVIKAEGLNPDRDVPLHLRRDIKARVAKHFKKAEEKPCNVAPSMARFNYFA